MVCNKIWVVFGYHEQSYNMLSMTLRTVGFAKTPFPDKFGTPRQPGLVPQARAFIKIEREFQPEISLADLSTFSHVWILFIFHKVTGEKFKAKVHPPRLNGQAVGVFATRSPRRPNPLGMSLVKLESVEKDGIWISGVDFIDGTPIVDIKPYLPSVESIPQARAPLFEDLQEVKAQVTWSEPAQTVLESDEQKNAIETLLSLDPRPQVYRGFESDAESKYRTEHKMRFENLDVTFSFIASDKIFVSEVNIV